ncbi:FAD/NAD(P)-binding domain-containing protein [Mycena indigotica]|uniref:FAD/NAD(P)-binding domain-containing protein n=1 Tax=Mycena indigotica TaxID=2126181 RepID=A0A8H6SHJ6_9AGAR|nr:FAD/NAD(P)-binding domain-containing protein [Mycena indigotica]KAF7298811.1 FAD/NAD(P)-binding domain-containing protein [Mycena indigotica]
MAHFPAPEHILSLSTVCVGVGPGGTTSMVARIVVVNFQGETILDKFVAPTVPVVDYRAAQTGITAWHLSSKDPIPFNVLQSTLAKLFRGKIVVGHSIWEHLSGSLICLLAILSVIYMYFQCSVFRILLWLRGMSLCIRLIRLLLSQPFRNALRTPNQVIGLQTLCWQLMRRRCGEGLIDPAENARAGMDLYRSHAPEWEASIARGNWPCSLPPPTYSRCYL